MGDTYMKNLIEKTLEAISHLEKVAYNPSITNVADNNKPKADVKVDVSDEANLDESDIFTTFNQAAEINSLKIDVHIDEDVVEEDIDEDSDDSIVESNATVFGQGTNPNPEDETYLNLLKKTAPKVKVKIKVDEE
jgi:hypothetical protein